MSNKKINKEDFIKFIETLIKSKNVIGVQVKADRFAFAALGSASDLRLDYDVTLQPPKIFFQPPEETLLTFDAEGNYQASFRTEPFILIGVHPYDMIALNQMDKLFTADNIDDHYMLRRNSATIIACDVVTPSKNVFASSMGTATVDKGYDVLLTDIGDCYVVHLATEEGNKLFSKAEGITDAAKDDLKKRDDLQQLNKERLNKHELKCKPADLPALLESAYNHPVWEEKAQTCFACGSCNQVCPTCYCFNVQDEVDWDLKSGKRCRAWDGCLLDGFTKVAGDHEFRKNRADRFRHRLYRKAKYVPFKIDGEIACIGCGRCVGACLPDIANPVAVYNRIFEDKNKEQTK
ncbi:MAG: 4Fe-4S dicluster domain-containing protein [Planctomycetota bacterium]|jgi:ferredoxin